MKVSGRYEKRESVRTSAENLLGRVEAVKGMIFVRIDQDYCAAKELIGRLNAAGLEVGELNIDSTGVTIVEHQQ